jgi:hypothetical protein
MKIGIITFHCAYNYGALLQTYALYQKLTNLFSGNEVFIVDYCPVSIVKVYSLIQLENVFDFIKSLIKLPFSIKRKRLFNEFKKKHLKFIDINDIHNLDYIVCGSDQIWNSRITKNVDPHYFGIIEGFSGKVITYAASDGGSLDTINEEILKNCLTHITAISVRESTMLPLLKQYRKDISVVLDPVFLLDKNTWETIASKRKYKKYILLYCISKEDKLVQDAYKLAKLKRIKIIEITAGFPFKRIFKNRHTVYLVGISDFLSYFLYAEYIFTNSFHGTAFSIIFNKNFFSYRLNNKKNDRIHGVLSEFNLINRYGEHFDMEKLKNIDYPSVNTHLVQEKNKSISFLTEALSTLCL